MRQIRVLGFGEWRLTVDGTLVEPLHSRMARELMLRMSCTDGPVARDRLVTELSFEDDDPPVARRRLTQELSRLNQAVGVSMWDGSRDWVQVRTDCVLSSDLDDLLRAAHPELVLPAEWDELQRLLIVLRRPERGELLPGQASSWIDERRHEVERAEVRQLKRAIDLADGQDPEAALRCAKRWAALEPFADGAHAAVVRLLARHRGRDVAAAYLDEVQDRYDRELGLEVGESVRRQLAGGDGDSADSGSDVLARLEGAARSSRAAGDADDEVAARHQAVDDHLRLVGLHHKRAANLDLMAEVAAEPVEVAWRRAELIVLGAADGPVAELDRSSEELDLASEPSALLAVMTCRSNEFDEHTRPMLRTIIERPPSAMVRAEAGLALAHSYDQVHEFGSAEAVLLQVCAEAEDSGLPYYGAQALLALGINRTRTGDLLQAERYLTEASDVSRLIGAEGVSAAAQFGFAVFNHHQQHLASALRCALLAAELVERLGDARSELRYRGGAAVAAHSIGDVETIRLQQDCVRRIDRALGRSNVYAQYTLRDIEAMLLEYTGNFEAALAIYEHQVSSAAEAGYRLGSLFNRLDVALMLLQLKRFGDAVVSAASMVTYAERNNVADHIANEAEGLLGVALIGAGDPEAGIVHLRRSTTATPFGAARSALYLAWLHVAACQLGLLDEAQSALVRGRRYIQAVRSDLTDAQWRTAVARRSELHELLALVEGRR